MARVARSVAPGYPHHVTQRSNRRQKTFFRDQDYRDYLFRQGWRCHLWQGRFASVVMDEPHLLAATRYVQRNPVKARLVARAADWPWSSPAAHVRAQPDPVAESAWLTERVARWVCTWEEFLADPDDPALVRALPRCETTGRPLGDRDCLRRIGAMLGRDLIPRCRGPKPRQER